MKTQDMSFQYPDLSEKESDDSGCEVNGKVVGVRIHHTRTGRPVRVVTVVTACPSLVIESLIEPISNLVH